jgi:hypothetical protein
MRPQAETEDSRRPPPTLENELDLAGEVLAYLRQESRRRDLPIHRLVRDLLDVVATDKLAGAILDND